MCEKVLGKIVNGNFYKLNMKTGELYSVNSLSKLKVSNL
jgi:hypothetical protein